MFMSNETIFCGGKNKKWFIMKIIMVLNELSGICSSSVCSSIKPEAHCFMLVKSFSLGIPSTHRETSIQFMLFTSPTQTQCVSECGEKLPFLSYSKCEMWTFSTLKHLCGKYIFATKFYSFFINNISWQITCTTYLRHLPFQVEKSTIYGVCNSYSHTHVATIIIAMSSKWFLRQMFQTHFTLSQLSKCNTNDNLFFRKRKRQKVVGVLVVKTFIRHNSRLWSCKNIVDESKRWKTKIELLDAKKSIAKMTKKWEFSEVSKLFPLTFDNSKSTRALM